jgi:peptidoglycan hydrolase-like protein with peptidoglycan-binding domain
MKKNKYIKNIALVIMLANFGITNALSVNYSQVYCDQSTNDLNLKDKQSVLKLQNFLKYLNIYPYKVNGVFDLKTKNALKKFEKQNKLISSGALSDTTINYIKNKYCRKTGEVLTVKNAPTASSTVSNNSILQLKDFQPIYMGGRIVALPAEKLCELKNSTLSWGNGKTEYYNQTPDFTCKGNSVTIYPDYGKYTATISRDGKKLLEIPINLQKGLGDRIFISKFEIVKSSGNFSVQADVDNAVGCVMYNERKIKIADIVPNSIVQLKLNENESFMLDCVDRSDRHAKAWAYSGDTANKNFLIKQLNFLYFNYESYAYWEVLSRSDRCHIGNLLNVDKSGVSKILLTTSGNVSLECYTNKGNGDIKELMYDVNQLTVLPEILELTYRKVKDFDYLISWKVNDASNCFLSGANLSSSYGLRTQVNPKSGEKVVNIFSGDRKVKLTCSSTSSVGYTKEVSKEIELN